MSFPVKVAVGGGNESPFLSLREIGLQKAVNLKMTEWHCISLRWLLSFFLFFTPTVSLTVDVAAGAKTRDEHYWHLPSGIKLIIEGNRPASQIPSVQNLPVGISQPEIREPKLWRLFHW